MKPPRGKKSAGATRRPAAGTQFITPNPSRPPETGTDVRRLKRESEIRQSEERYQSLFERSLDCVYLHDFKGNFLDANQATLDLLGYRRKDIGRLNFASLVTADQLPLAFKLTAEVMKYGRQLKPSEFRLRGRDGRQVYVETFSSLIYRDGKPYAIQGIARDLTARKRATEALRVSEKKFRQLFDTITDPFVSVNMAGQIQEFNAAYRKMLGYTDQELARLTYQDLTPKQWHAFEAGIIKRQVLSRGYSEVYEKEYRRKNGVVFPVELRTLLIRDDQEKPLMLWAIVRDISARKQSEKLLMQSNSLLSATLESTVDGILVVDTDGKVVTCNRRFLELWRIPEKLMAAGDDARLLKFSCDQLQQPEAFLSGVQKLYRQPGADSKDEILFKDGRIFKRYSQPQRVGDTIVGRVWCFRDITARRRAEEKLAVVDRALKTTSACNRALVRATNERDLLKKICRAIVEEGGYRMVWIGFPETDEKKSMRVVASAGYEKGYLQQVKINWSAGDERGRGPSGLAFRTGKIVVCKDFQTDPITRPWWKAAAECGYNSSISLPLKYAGEKFGLMMIYAGQAGAFDGDEKKLLGELAVDISYGMNALRVRQQAQLAEAALRASEDRFRKLFTEHAAVKLVTDAQTGQIVDGNEAAARFYGWPVAELKRMKIGQINTLTAAALKDVIKQVKTGKQSRFELQHRLADGSLREVEVFSNRIVIAGRTLLYSIIQDITQRKQAEAALEQSETRFRQIAASIEDVLYGVGSGNTEFNYVNPAFERMLGYTLEDVVRVGGREKFLTQVIQDGKFEEQRAVFRQLQASSTDAAPRWQSWWRCQDGSLKFIEDFWLPFYSKGVLQSTYGVLRDITERKRAEVKIQSALEFNQATIDALASHLCVLDERGNILATNQAWKNFAKTGPAPAKNTDVGGNYLAACDETVGPETADARAFAAGIRAVIHGEHDCFQLEYPCHSPTEQFWFMASVTRFNNSFPVRLVITHENITDRKQAAAALMESEWRFRDLLKNIPSVAVQSYGYDGTTHYWNHASEKLYGYTAEEAIGKNLLDLIVPPEMRLGVRRAIRQMAETGQPVPASEMTLMRKDGSRVVLFSSHAIVQVPGRPPELFCIDIDLTERQQMELALRASEENYRKLFATMLDGFAVHEIICDAAGRPVDYRFLSVNSAFERLTGLHAPDVVGRTVREVMPKTESKWIERYGRVALAGEAMEFEEYSDVLKKHFEIAAFQPKPGQFATVFIDITQRKAAELALRNSEEKFAAAFASNPAAIVLSRLEDGLLLDVNETWLKLSGFSRSEVIGRSAREMRIWRNPEVAGNFIATLRERGVVQNLEAEFFKKSGGTYHAQLSAQVLEMFGEKWILSALVDITQRKQAEAALLEIAGQLKESQRISALGTYVLDIASGKWSSSDLLDAILGIGPDYDRSVTGWEDLIHPDDRALMADHFHSEVLVQKRSFNKEYRILRPHSRAERWVHGLGKLECDAQGRPVRMIGTIRDITKTKRAMELMVASEIRYRRLFESAKDGILILDAETGKVVEVNPFLITLLGYSHAEFLGKKVWELGFLKDVIASEASFAELQAREYARYDDLALETSDGRRIEVEFISNLYRVNNQKVIQCNIRDISARKRAEEMHLRLSTAVEQAAETIVITDTGGTILYANPAFEKSSGYLRTEVIGQNPRILKSGRQDGSFYRRMWEAIQRGEVWTGHFINRRKDGILYEEEATISAIRDAAGKIINFVAVKRDVTHEVELEGQLRQSQKMEAIGTLAGGIAHDFNNILTVMFGYCNLLQLDLSGKPASLEKLGEIFKAAERAKDLVQQILTFSRQREQERQVIHLHNVLNEAVKLLRASFPANIQIEPNLAADAPAVLADATQIYQVLMNLGTNAMHAMDGQPAGRLAVTLDAFQPDEAFIQLHPDLRTIKYARLTVTDTGHGMDARILQRVFEPFFTTKPVGKGTGLGLAVVHGIVESHDGVITVESLPGQGATFRLYFPEQVQDMFLAGVSESKIPCGKGERILVVDDEATLIGMYQRLLKALKYAGTVTTSPQEAVSLVRKNPAQFDLVITDLTMPEMSGLELARQIRALRMDLPVILATGFKSTVTDRQLLDAGICQLLDKPIPMTTFANVLRDVLGKK